MLTILFVFLLLGTEVLAFLIMIVVLTYEKMFPKEEQKNNIFYDDKMINIDDQSRSNTR
jgi:hypothetical protein